MEKYQLIDLVHIYVIYGNKFEEEMESKDGLHKLYIQAGYERVQLLCCY